MENPSSVSRSSPVPTSSLTCWKGSKESPAHVSRIAEGSLKGVLWGVTGLQRRRNSLAFFPDWRCQSLHSSLLLHRQ